MLAAKPFDELAIPESLREKLTAKDDFLLLMFSPADKNFFNVKNVYQLSKEIKEVKNILEEKNISVSILNENLLAAEIMDWVKQKGPEAMVVAMVIVLLILILDLQSFVLAFKTFLPLLTGLIFTGAIMAFFQVKLNFINIVMLPSIIGIMIGSCVYLSHHILDYSMGATVKSVQETGSAIILSALTSLAGYASLNVAHHKGINSIATTVEIGIVVCTICALFLLPALFELNFGKVNKSLFKKRTDTNIPD
jgi:predicted RND superfamily exporter protein